jgi:hypothetical protein
MRAVDSVNRVDCVGDNDMAWNRTVLRLATDAPISWRSTTTTVRARHGRRPRHLTARRFYERFYGEVAAR